MLLNLDVKQAIQVYDFSTGMIQNLLVVDFGGKETQIPCSEEDLQHYIGYAMQAQEPVEDVPEPQSSEEYAGAGLPGVEEEAGIVTQYSEEAHHIYGLAEEEFSPVKLSDSFQAPEPEPTAQETRKASIAERIGSRARSKRSSERVAEARAQGGADRPRGLPSHQVDSAGNPVVKQKPAAAKNPVEEVLDEDGFPQG